MHVVQREKKFKLLFQLCHALNNGVRRMFPDSVLGSILIKYQM